MILIFLCTVFTHHAVFTNCHIFLTGVAILAMAVFRPAIVADPAYIAQMGTRITFAAFPAVFLVIDRTFDALPVILAVILFAFTDIALTAMMLVPAAVTFRAMRAVFAQPVVIAISAAMLTIRTVLIIRMGRERHGCDRQHHTQQQNQQFLRDADPPSSTLFHRFPLFHCSRASQ